MVGLKLSLPFLMSVTLRGHPRDTMGSDPKGSQKLARRALLVLLQFPTPKGSQQVFNALCLLGTLSYTASSISVDGRAFSTVNESYPGH